MRKALLLVVVTCVALAGVVLARPLFRSPPRVIIVGAGVAGLTAARTLTDETNAQVLLLEARPRVGGRISVDDSLGIPLDMGASWIHHVTHNPIYLYCLKRYIPTRAADYSDSVIVGEEGQWLDEAKRSLFWEHRDRFVNSMKNLPLKPHFSTAEAFQVIERDDQDTLSRSAAHWALRWDYELENGADAMGLSSYYSPADLDYGGIDHLLPGTYGQLVNALAEGLCIRLGEIVSRVEQTARGVVITTSQGRYEADYVIITLPLGVLKAGTVEFVPALPQEKRDSIQRLGMGVLAKVNLRFDHPFWPTQPQYLLHAPETPSPFPVWINFYPISGAPVLSTQTAGAFARSIEAMEPREAVEQAMKGLRVMFGKGIPDPIGATVTRWSGDPFAGGSYSYLTPESTEKDFSSLGKPVGRLLFAGEATHKRSYATVHGAYLSGVREARRLESYFR